MRRLRWTSPSPSHLRRHRGRRPSITCPSFRTTGGATSTAPGGFAVGLPRGWKARSSGSGSLIRSYDRLVAISILPDRSADALDVPIEDFANRAAEALRGFEGGLRPNGIWIFRHRYRAAAVGGEGTSERGVDQRVRLIVLRRDDQATFTVVIAANASRAARPSERLASRLVRTLRARPPEPRRRGGKGQSKRGGHERHDRSRSGSGGGGAQRSGRSG